MSERIDQCEGFDVLQARGKGSRWAVYRDSRDMGACSECGSRLPGVYRVEFNGTTRMQRFVCTSHPLGVTIPRVIGTTIEGVASPRPGSWGALRMAELVPKHAAPYRVVGQLHLFGGLS